MFVFALLVMTVMTMLLAFMLAASMHIRRVIHKKMGEVTTLEQKVQVFHIGQFAGLMRIMSEKEFYSSRVSISSMYCTAPNINHVQ